MFSPQVPTVNVRELSTETFLLDVREADEWAAGHAEAALHIPLSELAARVGEVPQDHPVAVVCRSGGRSAQATAYLNQGGWQARNVDGGMTAWAQAGRPMVCDSGAPPRVI